MKAATLIRRACVDINVISIHAAREGGDASQFAIDFPFINISIHAAREGGDGSGGAFFEIERDFNPRRP